MAEVKTELRVKKLSGGDVTFGGLRSRLLSGCTVVVTDNLPSGERILDIRGRNITTLGRGVEGLILLSIYEVPEGLKNEDPLDLGQCPGIVDYIRPGDKSYDEYNQRLIEVKIRK